MECRMLQERAAAGADLLDEKMPGWWQRVNTDTLMLSNPRRCVLGQLKGDYYNGLRAVGLGLSTFSDPYEPVDLLGFSLYKTDVRESETLFATLTDCWRAEIARRRLAAINTASESELELVAAC